MREIGKMKIEDSRHGEVIPFKEAQAR